MTTDENPSAKIARLEAENEALRRSAAQAEAAQAEGPQSGGSRTGGSRWRSVGSATLIVLGLVLGSVSAVTSYTNALLTDTDQFVATFAPLAADPAVQAVLVQATNDVIDKQVDIPALTADVFDGLRALDMPPKASAALSLLQAPVAQGAKNLVHGMVQNVITSPTFAEVWEQALRVSHEQALTIAGQISRGDQGAHGGHGRTNVLGFSNRARLRELEASGVTRRSGRAATDLS